MVNLYRKDFVTCIGKVTGNDVCGKHKVLHVGTGKLNNEFLVADFNLPQSCAVDDWCHTHYFTIIILKNRVFLKVLDDVTVFLSLWMCFYDFAESLNAFTLKRLEFHCIRITCVEVDWPLNVCLAVNTH